MSCAVGFLQLNTLPQLPSYASLGLHGLGNMSFPVHGHPSINMGFPMETLLQAPFESLFSITVYDLLESLYSHPLPDGWGSPSSGNCLSLLSHLEGFSSPYGFGGCQCLPFTRIFFSLTTSFRNCSPKVIFYTGFPLFWCVCTVQVSSPGSRLLPLGSPCLYVTRRWGEG